MKRLALLLMLLAPCWLPAAGDDVRIVTSATASSSVNPVKLDVGKFIWLSVPSYEDDVTLIPDPEDQKSVTLYKVKADTEFPLGAWHQGDLRSRLHRSPKAPNDVYQIAGEEPGLVTLSAWGVKVEKREGLKDKLTPIRLNQVVISVGGVKPVPPTPTPTPTPTPEPTPVQSFRVIMVTETSQALTAHQQTVLLGNMVEDYLKANTTPEGGVAGFRRWDKDTNASKDFPTMAALWDAAKPKITTVPCWIVERNGKVEIIQFPANVTDALATLKKYREGK